MTITDPTPRSADLDVVWALADRRGEEIQALSRRCMELAIMNARLRMELADLRDAAND